MTTHRAQSSVPAGVAVTLLQLQLTVDPSEPWKAGTGVATLACVHAGSPVHTWPVVGAEVQVWRKEGDKCYTVNAVNNLQGSELYIHQVRRALKGD